MEKKLISQLSENFEKCFKKKGKILIAGNGGSAAIANHIAGEFVVDNNHLVAYSSNIKMSIGLSGGLISSLTSGEGLVYRLKGNGVIYLQSRSIEGLVQFLSPKVR